MIPGADRLVGEKPARRLRAALPLVERRIDESGGQRYLVEPSGTTAGEDQKDEDAIGIFSITAGPKFSFGTGGPVEAYVGAAGGYYRDMMGPLSDDGAGFSVADRTPADEPDLHEGGLGIAIIRELADELELGRKGDGQGSRLRLVKFIQV